MTALQSSNNLDISVFENTFLLSNELWRVATTLDAEKNLQALPLARLILFH